MNNLIFDIKEFGLHDGNGMRTTVFFKGCPLRCEWCHNPEGQSFERELIRNTSKCVRCGLCEKPCAHEACAGLNACIKRCPQNCLTVAGVELSPEKLSEELLKNKDFLINGGVTFSGGEPLCHGEFIRETVKRLDGISTAVETCGYVETGKFIKTASVIDDIFMDIKLFDNSLHKKYTGVNNKLILQNAIALLESGKLVTFRVPLIPNVTDTNENLSLISDFLAPYCKNLRVELIPYNRMTGAKYKSVGREYAPSFDENAQLNKNTLLFTNKNIKCIAY